MEESRVGRSGRRGAVYGDQRREQLLDADQCRCSASRALNHYGDTARCRPGPDTKAFSPKATTLDGIGHADWEA